MQPKIVTRAVDHDGWEWEVQTKNRRVLASSGTEGVYQSYMFAIGSQGELVGQPASLAKELPPELIPACRLAAGLIEGPSGRTSITEIELRAYEGHQYIPEDAKWVCLVTYDGVTSCGGWGPTKQAANYSCQARRNLIGVPASNDMETLEIIRVEMTQIPKEELDYLKRGLAALLAGTDCLKGLLDAVGMPHVLKVIQPPYQTSCRGCQALIEVEGPGGHPHKTCCLDLSDGDPDSLDRPEGCRNLAG